MMPIGKAKARTPRESERRNRTAVGVIAGRIHRAGTSLKTGDWRRARATIRFPSRLSIAALTALRIARGYVRAPSAATVQAPAHHRAREPTLVAPSADRVWRTKSELELAIVHERLAISRRPRSRPSYTERIESTISL
jgi:hypothetical protein